VPRGRRGGVPLRINPATFDISGITRSDRVHGHGPHSVGYSAGLDGMGCSHAGKQDALDQGRQRSSIAHAVPDQATALQEGSLEKSREQAISQKASPVNAL
jgi:hypothetical protein